MKRADFIINPISGQGASLRAADVAERLLRAAGVSVVRHVTTSAGEGRAIASRLDPSSSLVVAVGGDGTLNEVVTGLTANIPVGLVPVGTANVVARDLRIPLAARRAAELILSGDARPIDVGRINDRRFLAMLGVGFDGAIVHAIAEARRGPISKLTYVRPSLRALSRYRSTPLALTVDGVRVDGPVFGAIIANTRNYGGFFAAVPQARIDDGLLHWVAYRRPGKFALLQSFIAAATRREMGATHAVYGSGRVIRIESQDQGPVPMQADGDDYGFLPATITILPAAARVIRPPAIAANGAHA